MKPRNTAQGGTLRAAWTGTLLGSLLLACSSAGTPPLDPGPTAANPSSGGSSGGVDPSTSGSSGGTSSSGSGSGGTNPGGSSGSPGGSSGSTNPAPINDAGTATPNTGPPDAAPIDKQFVGETKILSSSFMVPAGTEVYKCQAFPNPFGADVDLIHFDGTMTQDSHHFFLFNLSPLDYFAAPKGSMQDCPSAGTEIHPFPYLSQQPHWVTEYPKEADGTPLGYRIPKDNALELNVHFVNPGSTAVTATVSIAVTAAKTGVVKTHVGTLFLDDTNASISGSSATQTTTGSWPGNPGAQSTDGSYTIFQSWSHMHQWGSNFKTSNSHGLFYTEPHWQEPPVWWHLPGYVNPKDGSTGSTTPVKMGANEALTWSCDWMNTTGGPLKFGQSAQHNIMCIYAGQYYPANPANPDVLYSTMAAGFPGH